MSEIKVGDLVCNVRPSPCCGNTSYIGEIFRVSHIRTGKAVCVSCRATGIATRIFGSEDIPTDLRRLRRIPPLSELESTEHKEETPA